MKRTTAALATALGLALGTSTVALAATTTTTDVHTLATAESRVVALLDHYSNSPAWTAQYKAAVAAQTSEIAKVNADLSPKARQTSLTWTTSGTLQTPPFIVRGTFTLRWNITAPQGGLCELNITSFDFYPAGSNVNNANDSAEFDENGCQSSSSQVTGISGAQFLYIQTTGAVVVTITGAVTP
jgi:hypothetical protein